MIHCNELKQMCNTVISSSRYNSKIQIIGINNELRMGEAWYDCPINTDKMTAQVPISQYSTISTNINNTKLFLLNHDGLSYWATNHSILLNFFILSFACSLIYESLKVKQNGVTHQLHTPSEGLSWLMRAFKWTVGIYIHHDELVSASDSTKRTSFATGRTNEHDLSGCLLPTRSFTFLTKPSSDG